MRPMSMEPAGSPGEVEGVGAGTGPGEVGADAAFDLSMAVSQLASNSTDLRIMLKLLVSQLSDVLGDRISVERAGRFRKSDEIKSVRIGLGDDTLEAVVDGRFGALQHRALLGWHPHPQRAGRHGRRGSPGCSPPCKRRPRTASRPVSPWRTS